MVNATRGLLTTGSGLGLNTTEVTHAGDHSATGRRQQGIAGDNDAH